MLDDPDLNVRAAVLKELAEKPPASIATNIAEYVEKETDADLLVHAIRVLQEVKGKLALASMLKLLKNESWQVRAAAAEGVGKAISSSGIADNVKANACVELIGLLKDGDAFVVSRGVEGLSGVQIVEAIEPLVDAANRFPELAPDIVGVLVNGTLARKALPHLRAFSKHEEPRVRIAAISGLGMLANDEAAGDFKRALRDADGEVRHAAADALFSAIVRSRPDEDELIRQARTVSDGGSRA